MPCIQKERKKILPYIVTPPNNYSELLNKFEAHEKELAEDNFHEGHVTMKPAIHSHDRIYHRGLAGKRLGRGKNIASVYEQTVYEQSCTHNQCTNVLTCALLCSSSCPSSPSLGPC